MTSHIDSTLRFNKHNTTEAGIPMLVDDFETNDDWWAQHSEGVRPCAPASAEPGSLVLVADIDAEAPAWCIETFTSLREPDMYDNGLAFWITQEAVVYIDVERVPEIQGILDKAERIHFHTEGSGWTKVHPSQYGIQVEWFNGSAHPAHTSWALALQAIEG